MSSTLTGTTNTDVTNSVSDLPTNQPSNISMSSVSATVQSRSIRNPYVNTKPKMNSSFPLKPQGWATVDDVRDNENTKTNNLSSFDFVISSFGPTCVFCPRCNSPVLQKGRQLSKIKLIHTMRVPRFVQGLSLKCSLLSCNFGFTSYQKNYVDTLPSVFKSQLNAIIDG